MDKKLKARWLKALRSRKFKQGKGQLKQGSGKAETFCCLGVLCAIVKAFPATNDLFLPPALAFEAGISRQVEVVLSNLNDGTNRIKAQKFGQIANYIERNL